MRIPFIKSVNKFIALNDIDFIHETISVLEHLIDDAPLKDEEMDTMGELLSTLYAALEVQKNMEEGKTEKEALNDFMQRVLGSIDK